MTRGCRPRARPPRSRADAPGDRRIRRPPWRTATTCRPRSGSRCRDRPGGARSDRAYRYPSSLRTSSARLLLLLRPLRVGQAPAAAERLVEPDVSEKPVAANLRERALGRVELLLGLEHLEVIGEPVAIAIH